MRKLHAGLLLTIMALFLASSTYGQKAKDVTKEIQEINEFYMKATLDKDVDGMMSIQAPDVRVFPPNAETIEGKENLREMFTGLVSWGSLELEAVVAEAYGKTAIEEGRWKFLSQEGQVVDTGRYIVVWKKVDGQWLMYRDIWNSEKPMEE